MVFHRFCAQGHYCCRHDTLIGGPAHRTGIGKDRERERKRETRTSIVYSCTWRSRRSGNKTRATRVKLVSLHFRQEQFLRVSGTPGISMGTTEAVSASSRRGELLSKTSSLFVFAALGEFRHT